MPGPYQHQHRLGRRQDVRPRLDVRAGSRGTGRERQGQRRRSHLDRQDRPVPVSTARVLPIPRESRGEPGAGRDDRKNPTRARQHERDRGEQAHRLEKSRRRDALAASRPRPQPRARQRTRRAGPTSAATTARPAEDHPLHRTPATAGRQPAAPHRERRPRKEHQRCSKQPESRRSTSGPKGPTAPGSATRSTTAPSTTTPTTDGCRWRSSPPQQGRPAARDTHRRPLADHTGRRDRASGTGTAAGPHHGRRVQRRAAGTRHGSGCGTFVEETPDERREPYDHNWIIENIAEGIQARLKAVTSHHAARAALCGVTNPVDHVEITIAELRRVHADTGKSDPSALNEACHQIISDFVATHHRELVAHNRRTVTREPGAAPAPP